MASYSATAGPTRRPQPKLRTSALSEIGFNSITAAADSDLSTSGDEADKTIPAAVEEDASSVVGVSIGKAQTRLTSPTTPAIEKAAAIAESGGFFGGKDIGTLTEDNEEATALAEETTEADVEEQESQESRTTEASLDSKASSTTLGLQSTQSSRRLDPSTTGVEKKSGIYTQPSTGPKRSRAGAIRHSISSFSDVLSQRKHSSSLSEMSRKMQDFNLPSFPKTSAFLQNFSVSGLLQSGSTQPARTEDDLKDFDKHVVVPHVNSDTNVAGAQAPIDTPERPNLHQRRSTITGTPTSALSPIHSHGRPSFDALSLAPSLGDDGRFIDVREQVNSRKKAITDTIDDIHLPSLPSFGNFNFGPSPRSKSTADRDVKITAVPVESKARFTTEHMAHPQFYRALDDLKGDIVILGGYRGSVLKSAGPDARRLWIPLAVTMNLRKVNLEVGLDREDEETEDSRVVPAKMLSHIGPIDISRRLLRRLRECPNAKTGKLRVHNWGWDWRLSPALTSEKFRRFLRGLPCNQPGADPSTKGAVVIAHSLGGLITRHAINREPQLFSRVLYAGVPQHAVNILGPLRNGDDVALNSRVLTAQVNFTIRTSFALLPLSGQCFYDAETKEEIPVDFFNVEHWKEYKWSPVISRPLPPADAPSTQGRNSIVDSMASILSVKAMRTAERADAAASGRPAGLTPQMHDGHDTDVSADPKDPKLAVTLPYDRALSYLERTLAETKTFLEELAYKPDLAGLYPRLALIYGKNIPTCRGAKVNGREGIKRSDAYDNLLFGSGDGVVLAKAAMLPEGYRTVKKGVVLSEKSHVSLLSDLDAVGKCLSALHDARRVAKKPDTAVRSREGA